MSAANPPNKGATMPERDLEDLARRLVRHPAYSVRPGMLFRRGDHAVRAVAGVPRDLPGGWLPGLTDSATGGVLLEVLGGYALCVTAARVSLTVPAAGHPGAWDEVPAWEVVARDHKAAHRATATALGVAVADALLALGGAS